MKILFCTDSLGAGGAEKQMALLAARLVEANNEVVVWSLHEGSFAETLNSSKISVITAPLPISQRKVRVSVSELLTSFKPDVIHIWGTAVLLMCYWVFMRSSIPLVNGFIRFGTLSGSISSKLRALLCARIGDVVVANSKAGLKACHVSRKKSRVLPNGFDWSRVISQKCLNKETDRCNVVMCANITKYKNYNLLVDLAHLAAEKYNNSRYRFFIIGRPIPVSELDPIQRKAEDLIENGAVKLIGGVDNPFPHLLASDIGILLSTRGEGISNSIMEYMAAHLPVICTDVGGNPELVDDMCGILLKKDKPEFILKKLDFLYENPSLRKQMGNNGYARIKEYYSIQSMLKSALKIYQEVQR